MISYDKRVALFPQIHVFFFFFRFLFFFFSFFFFSLAPFFRPIAPVGRSPIGVAFGILWNGERRPRERSDPEGRSVWDFTYNHEALDLTSASSLGFRLRPHNRCDPKPRRDRQNGTKKKRACRRDWTWVPQLIITCPRS